MFGVSSDEYLNYALENRDEWAQKGEAIVEELKAKYCAAEKEQAAPMILATLEAAMECDEENDGGDDFSV